MTPAQLDTKTLTRGDLWEDVYHFGPFTVEGGGALPFAACLSCRIQFRRKGRLGYELNNDPSASQGTITIVDATNYEFDIPIQDLPLGVGTWEWDLECFETVGLADSTPRTFLKGIFTIEQDISHD